MWAFALEGTSAPDRSPFPGLGDWVSGVHGCSVAPTLQSQASGDRVLSDLMMGLGFPEMRGRGTGAVPHPPAGPQVRSGAYRKEERKPGPGPLPSASWTGCCAEQTA